MAHSQKPRRVPSSSSISTTAGYSLAPEAASTHRTLRTVDSATPPGGILGGLPAYSRAREKAASRMPDETTGSDRGKERQGGDRPSSSLSTHSRPEHRRNRDGERQQRIGEDGRRQYGTSDKASTPSEVASEAERPKGRDRDRYLGLQRRERGADADKEKENGRMKERHLGRDRDGHRERGAHGLTNSVPETPATEEEGSAQTGSVRLSETLRPSNLGKESDTRNLLSEVPLAVQEAWICEDLGYVLQVCGSLSCRLWANPNELSHICRESKGRSSGMIPLTTGRIPYTSYAELGGP